MNDQESPAKGNAATGENIMGEMREDLRIRDLRARAAEAEQRGDWKAAARYYARILDERAVELALINSVQEGLSSKYEMQAIYDLVGDKLRDTFNAQVVMISRYDPLTHRVYHHYAIERGKHIQISGWHPIDASRAKVIQTKKPWIINQAQILGMLKAEEMSVIPGTEVPKTWLGVPLMVRDQARGIVSLQNLDIENAFSNSDIDLLTTLTNSMSQSLENARLFNETQRLLSRLEREMGLARQAQKSILPTHFPSQPGYDFGSLMVPARAVGGDFYDMIPLGKEQLCITIGDVSDKGLPAALFMAVTMSLIRVETARNADQCQVLENINKFLLRMNAKMFVTLLYCNLDFNTGNLNYCRAGHLPPIVIDADGNFVELNRGLGQPLGVFDDLSIDQGQFIIPEGGLALLFSDGLHEAINALGQPFGLERVKSELIAHRHESAQMICRRLWYAVEYYSGETSHQDDFTTLVIKRSG